MGSFAITYDDFSGGHYMGNKSASLPSNTWFGTNCLLNSQGELIPGSTALFDTFTHPSTWQPVKIHQGWTRYSYTYYVVTFQDPSTSNVETRLLFSQTDGLFSTPSSSGQIALSGTMGSIFPTYGVYNPQDNSFYYITNQQDLTWGQIRKFELNGATDTLVSSTFVSSSTPYYLGIYKSRMIAWGHLNKFFYSDNTMSTWNITDYYELPGNIRQMVSRANDIVAITDTGVYSITGVLGSSVNIQQIAPANELVPGIEGARASGRSVYFLSLTDQTNPTMMELLGATTTQIANFNQSDLNDFASNLNQFKAEFNILHGGQLVAFLDNGVMYLRSLDGTWRRLYAEVPQGIFIGQNIIADQFPDLLQSPVDDAYAIVAVVDNAEDVLFYKYKIGGYYPSPVYENVLPDDPAPFSSSVKLPEYWHQKPFTVRELLVEAIYDTENLLDLSGNASIAAQVIPTGAVDYTVNQTNALTSTTQTYTTPISSVNANGSRVLHRFRTDDAIKAYGFYPQITWQGCRIRRVIAICED